MLSHHFDALRALSLTPPKQLQVAFGEMTAYDPTRHMAKFELPMHPDDLSGDPITTEFIPIGTPFSGVGYGMQFTPPMAAQAIIIYIDAERVLPICGFFLYNDIEQPPWPKGDFSGIVDQYGNQLKWSQARSAVISPGVLELGIELLDPILDAVVTVRTLRTYVEAIFNTHTHSGVQTGVGVSGTPATTMLSAGSLKVKASP